MTFYCELCDYTSKNKSKIQKHHIVPKEKSGTNYEYNVIFLCPTCHTNIFIPDSKFGNHSIKSSKSIIINRKVLSTEGMMLEYVDESGNTVYSKIKN
jgi:hypothetical protein